MTKDLRAATLSSLQQVRTGVRLDAEAAVHNARQGLERAEQTWLEARAKLSKLVVAERRDAEKVSAGALQRAEACRVALSTAHARASQQVKDALKRMQQARLALAQAEDGWRGARAEERVVERVVERQQADAQSARLRAEDEDNDDLSQRR